MTNEEAIESLNGCIVSEEYKNGKANGNVTCDLTREVLGMAIDALREKMEREKEHIGEATNMIPKPVVHGEWVLVGTNEHDYETSVEEKCSLCGRYVYRYDTEPQDNYCPNCGAKMDKETENERDD